ncbi:MAG: 3-methyl-2-oxobutanoate dehydrogenase subunit beta, partial [Clostridiales bacterium]|nr:3-methyl-2-oxobutanoate dehydrogenase subunit beta [Clostridiales bacterium]
EIYELVVDAFNLADKYRMMVMIMGDGTLGQMMEPVAFRDEEPIENIAKPWAACGRKGDDFHHTVTSIYIDPDVLEKKNIELQEKYKIVEANEVRYESVCMDDDPEIVITAFSTCSRISRNVIRQARDMGIKVGMIRPITLWPFPSKPIAEAADMPSVKGFIDVELNAGQMIEDVRLAVNGKKPVYFHGRMGGNLPMQKEILDKIVAIHEGTLKEGGIV